MTKEESELAGTSSVGEDGGTDADTDKLEGGGGRSTASMVQELGADMARGGAVC